MNITETKDKQHRVANGQAGDHPADAIVEEEALPGANRQSVSMLAADLRAALRREADAVQGILWLPVAMALGTASWFGLSGNPPVAFIALPFVLLVAWLAAYDHGRSVLATTLAAGFLAGMLAAEVETRLGGTVLLDSEITTRLHGTVVDRDMDHAGRWRYTVEVEKTFDPEIRRPPRRVRLVARARHEPIHTGSGIGGLARLQPPSGPVLPGEFDFSFHAYFQGIGANGYFYGAPESTTVSGEFSNTSFLNRRRQELVKLRETISARIREVLPGEAGSLASALTVAERRSIHPDLVEALRASGLAHILAISGLHMALVAGTFFFFVRTCFSLFPSLVQAVPIKKIAACGALLVATVYLVISGASVSTQRAFIMLAIVLGAVLLDRRALTMRNVALAAIVIILITPSAVVGPGFQMSFAATAALIATYEIWDSRWSQRVASDSKPVAGWISSTLVFFTGLAVTSLVAGLATAPFAIFHFHRVATFGLFANLAAMPIVTFVVMPAGLFSLLAMPLGLEYWPLFAMGKGLDAVIAIADYVASLGGARVVGRLNIFLFGAMVSGFLIFVLLHTRLRLTGIAIMGVAVFAFAFSGPGRSPDLLISEDGRLIAIVASDSLATNRARPAKFTFDQWRRALIKFDHLAPISVQVPTDIEESRHALSVIFKHMEDREPAFICVDDSFCAGVTPGGKRVILVENLAYIGAACDRADLVVTAKRITMQRCYSDALLVTGRMLRQSGSLEISFDGRHGAPRVRSAIADADRPWIKHRYYNWRSRAFEHDPPEWLHK